VAVTSADIRTRGHALTARTAGWLSLCVLQMLVVAWLCEPPSGIERWRPVLYLRDIATWLMLSGAALAVLSWPQRGELGAFWRGEQARHNWQTALAANLSLFAVLVLTTIAFTAQAAAGASVPRQLVWLHSLLLGATAVSLLRLDLSIRSLLEFVFRYRIHVVSAGCVGLAVLLFMKMAIGGWDVLAAATLELTKGLLQLYESGVSIDPAERLLTVKSFTVRIDDSCSGYEGIALVTAFLSLYLWAFRSQLRFPHAFLLVPVGLGAVWLLNSVRIAALVSLGAHVSPDLAIHGFHSQAGWIAFLSVTVGIMALAQKSALLRAVPRRAPAAVRSDDRGILAYLVPFIALMIASIIMAASAPYDRPLYALKVVAVGLTLWMFRDVYRRWTWRISPLSVLAGVAVGAAWIATDPAPSGGSELRVWLEGQGVAAATVWLALRVLGATVMVPVAEELAFRGFLHRWLISRNFESVPIGQWSLTAFAVSSLLFGAMHTRWIAGALSGTVFAVVMYRTNRLSDPIAAHVTANATICAWAVACGQWSLL
jgi:exosortase E/protease (VPEID-CTERM system)